MTKRYDWKACAFALVIAFAVAIPAGLAVASLYDSTLLLTAVVTVVGTTVSRMVYARMAKPGSRPIDDES
jgi:hypothetical protein